MPDQDEQLLSTLEVVQEQLTETQALNRRLKEGFMGVSEARFGSRWNKINKYSFPAEIQPTLRVVLKPASGGRPPHWEVRKEKPILPARSGLAKGTGTGDSAKARNGEGLRKRNVGTKAKDNSAAVSGGGEKSEDSRPRDTTTTTKSPARSPPVDNLDPQRDPLTWFGLPPPSLRRAQTMFCEAFEKTVPHIANLTLDIAQRVKAYSRTAGETNVDRDNVEEPS
eukprot:INCI8797.1.p1 GENE.INCI8797.1~~INCI8797.1.p1  ORF type:complete len:224 (+),score=29.96 INCI8797.1:111-782(+)